RPMADPTPIAETAPRASAAPLDRDEVLFLRRLVLFGFLVRAVLALVLKWNDLSLRFAPDEDTYAWHGLAMAQYWAGDLFVRPWRFGTAEPHGYFYLNAIFFYVFGNTELPIRLVNCLLGALCCRVVYLITRDLYDRAVARRAAMLCAYFPSLVL